MQIVRVHRSRACNVFCRKENWWTVTCTLLLRRLVELPRLFHFGSSSAWDLWREKWVLRINIHYEFQTLDLHGTSQWCRLSPFAALYKNISENKNSFGCYFSFNWIVLKILSWKIQIKSKIYLFMGCTSAFLHSIRLSERIPNIYRWNYALTHISEVMGVQSSKNNWGGPLWVFRIFFRKWYLYIIGIVSLSWF